MLMDDKGSQAEAEDSWKYSTESSVQEFDGQQVAQSEGVPMQQIPAIEWTASEYVAHEKTASWYLLLAGGGIIVVAFIYLITKDILASTVVFLASITIGIYAGRKPSTNNYLIDENGVQIKEVFHPYREFKSFSVVEEGALDSIWLKPIKRFRPAVVMYFPPEDEVKITDVLSNFLPHEDRELDSIDRLSRKMRF